MNVFGPAKSFLFSFILVALVCSEGLAQTPAQCFSNPSLCKTGSNQTTKNIPSIKKRTDVISEVFNKYDAENRVNIQHQLLRLGFYRSKVDGLFGPGTRRAITVYLRWKGVGQSSAEKIKISLDALLHDQPKKVAGLDKKQSQASAESKDIETKFDTSAGVEKKSLQAESQKSLSSSNEKNSAPKKSEVKPSEAEINLNEESANDIVSALKNVLDKHPEIISLRELVLINQMTQLIEKPWSEISARNYSKRYIEIRKSEELVDVLDGEIEKVTKEKKKAINDLIAANAQIIVEITKLILQDPLAKQSLIFAERVAEIENVLKTEGLVLSELSKISQDLKSIRSKLGSKPNTVSEKEKTSTSLNEQETKDEEKDVALTDANEQNSKSGLVEIDFEELVRAKAFGDGIDNYYASDGFVLVGVSLTLSGDINLSAKELLSALRASFEGKYNAEIIEFATTAFAAQNSTTNVFETLVVPLEEAFQVVFEVPSQIGVLSEVTLVKM